MVQISQRCVFSETVSDVTHVNSRPWEKEAGKNVMGSRLSMLLEICPRGSKGTEDSRPSSTDYPSGKEGRDVFLRRNWREWRECPVSMLCPRLSCSGEAGLLATLRHGASVCISTGIARLGTRAFISELGWVSRVFHPQGQCWRKQTDLGSTGPDAGETV